MQHHTAKRVRADQLLVECGLAENRTKAQALILSGVVFIAAGQRVEKPGSLLFSDRKLELRGQNHPWVSRGGVKLDHGLRRFGFSPIGRACLDIGASTGGFTDVLLRRGALRVYSVDVGYGQLDWRLRNDSRVVVIERVNARYLSENHVPEPITAVVCDASFIGLSKVLPAPLARCAGGAWAVALIKPQFEVGPALAKGGVVRNPDVHTAVCNQIVAWWSRLQGWRVLGVEPSPLLGPEGNREFLLGAVRDI